MLLDATETQHENDIGGDGAKGRPTRGIYHMALNMVETKTKDSKLTVYAEAVIVREGLTGYKKVYDEAGKLCGIEGGNATEDQQGRVMPKTFWLDGKTEENTEKCLSVLKKFAFAIGALQPGQSADIEWTDFIGREFIGEIINDKEYTTKSGEKAMGVDFSMYGYWSLGNPIVANVPKEANSLGMQAFAKAGIKVHNPLAKNGNGNGATKAPPTTPASTEASAAAAKPRSKYADL